MNKKRILRYTIIFPILFSVIVGTVYAFSELAKKREQSRLIFEQDRRKTIHLLILYEDNLNRHPDLNLSRAREFFFEYNTRSEQEQVENLYQLETAYAELEAKTMQEMIGTDFENREQAEIAGYKTFSPNGFKDLYDSQTYPKEERMMQPPHITGDKVVDERIIRLAEERGYRLRAEADPGELESFDRHSLRNEAMDSWLMLKEAALEEGIQLGLISAYRSIARQRQIFLNLFREESLREAGREYSTREIAVGLANGVINNILGSSSIPGYSKHHTGYAVDITDLSSGKHYTDFANTRGFEWISANNYFNAKRFGFIPSYADGATNQGPEPEAWEYVWVGQGALKRESYTVD